jgi:PAS domain S-box-containing protein
MFVETESLGEASRQYPADIYLRAILSGLPVLLFTLDEKYRFVLLEGSAAQSLGVTPKCLVGHDIRDVFQQSATLAEALDSASLGVARRVELERNGVIFATHLGAMRTGKRRGVVGVAIDITSKRRVENRLRLNEERLRLSQEYANIGTWDYCVSSGELYISEHMREFLGRKDAPHCTLGSFLEAVPPEDRQQVQQALDASLRDGLPYDIEHRLICDDGRTIWLHEKGKPAYSDDGEPLQLLGIIQDVSERKQAEVLLQQTMQELRAAKEEAEKANRAKSDFLSRMSHELRTPLNSVLGFAQLLHYDDDPELSAGQQEYVGHILKSGNHLLQLINEVLDLAAIEVGKLPVHMENLSLHPPVTDCLAIAAALARRESIALVDELGESAMPWVRADALRLKQVLLNLLSNAIKYNRPHGQVRLYAGQPCPGRVRLCVEDTGPGLPPEKLDSLFQPFNRLGLEYGDIEGSGIGLVITKSLVELMGGTMGVKSEVGVGSTFWFELETCQEQALDSPDAQGAATPPAQPLVERRLHGIVLYLHNNQEDPLLIEEVCHACGGVGLLQARSVEQALSMAERHDPQVILLDLPGESGLAAYRQLRESASGHIPVVIVSADAMAASIEAALAAGVQAYLTKPLDLPALVRTLEEYLIAE